MNTFINVQGSIINLKNVSNINLQDKKNRIIFNLNYTINLPNSDKQISDYVYWDFESILNFVKEQENLLENDYIFDNFLCVNNYLINKNEISSVKFDDKKHRIIFNLSNTITFIDKHKNQRLTSEFIYIDCDGLDDFIENEKYIKLFLGL